MILLGDALEQLRTLAAGSVHCCVTSPPYFGLRDYGVEGQIGLEKTPDEFIAKMVALFRELRRVLRDDGTLWLNMGDSYTSTATSDMGSGPSKLTGGRANQREATKRPDKIVAGLPQKNLMGMPWRLALALQADGWWLRADIIWSKPNPMPSSVTDRPTTAHEYIFLLTKSAKYFYDEFAVREASVGAPLRNGFRGENDGPSHYVNQPTAPRNDKKFARNGKNAFRGQGAERDGDSGPANRDDRDMSTVGIGATRNMRSVWTMATEPFSDAHFATFPTALPAKCIAAGTSERGVCPTCGAPWVRIVERSVTFESGSGRAGNPPEGKGAGGPQIESGSYDVRMGGTISAQDSGWRAGCDHGAEPVPAIVIDPFFGAGTTGVVAKRMGRSYIGVELNPAYIAIAEKRLGNINPLFT